MRFYDWRTIAKRSTFAVVNLTDYAADKTEKSNKFFKK